MARGLGRGFSSLIPTDLIDEEFDPTAESDKEVSKLLEIDIDKIARDENQPRKTFSEESLAELASSIKQHGILQPLVLIEEDGKYVIKRGREGGERQNWRG